MKNLRSAITLFLIAACSVTFAQNKKASPAETAKGEINGATITINYGSPSVKGREIWGKLVPFGEVWRAGANEATTFETSKDVMVEGQKLPAGKYSLFIIPEKDKATVIFNTTDKQWGSYDYDAKKDQLRVVVKPVATKEKTEKMTISIDKTGFALAWDNWNIPVKVK